MDSYDYKMVLFFFVKSYGYKESVKSRIVKGLRLMVVVKVS